MKEYSTDMIMNLMEDIKYGWCDTKNTIHTTFDDSFNKYYKLQSPEETINNKIGICWDQVELERYYFKNTKYKIKTYFIVHYDNNACPTHTFLVYKDNNKYYWFEHSWSRYKGIHKYNSLNKLLKDVYQKFIISELNNNYEKDNLILREYQTPKYGLNIEEFYHHCEEGLQIII